MNVRVFLMSFRVAAKIASGTSECHRRDVLSIQKLLQKSTGSAGLLMLGQKAIVLFKKVALNFPPLEQGPAGK
jgi:hypothetical protein